MIISHKLRVIYIKLSKVASTSFELALSKYCGLDDILTPIGKGGCEYRESGGFPEARNYMDPETQEPRFTNHIYARKIKKLVPTHIGNDYLKVATIRCPYDMLISGYYFFPLESKIGCPKLLETFRSITAKQRLRPKEGASSYEVYSKYPNAKLIIDQRFSELAKKYEFFQKYWPMYKSKLEKDIKEYQATKT